MSKEREALVLALNTLATATDKDIEKLFKDIKPELKPEAQWLSHYVFMKSMASYYTRNVKPEHCQRP